MKIKEPTWWRTINGAMDPQFSIDELKDWFRQNIAPYEFYDPKDAVEVYGENYIANKLETYWRRNPTGNEGKKALLINIEPIPIKKETAEDILKDMIKVKSFHDIKEFADIIERARSVVEGK